MNNNFVEVSKKKFYKHIFACEGNVQLHIEGKYPYKTEFYVYPKDVIGYQDIDRKYYIKKSSI